MRRTLFLGVMLCVPWLATAAEWSQSPLGPAAPDVWADRLMADGNAYVVIGRNSNRATWSRVAADGSVDSRRVSIAGAIDAHIRAFDVVPLGNQRFFTPAQVDTTNNACRVHIVDSNSDVVGRASYPNTMDPSCMGRPSRAALDATGGVWINRLNTPFALRIQADGVIQSISAPAHAADSFQFSPLHQASAAYALFRSGQRWTLARLDGNELAWSFTPANDNIQFRHVLTAANGDALVVGLESPDFAAGPLYLARFSPQGQLRWSRTFNELESVQLSYVRHAADERLLIAARAGLNQPVTLHSFAGDGELQWSRNFSDEAWQSFVSGPSDDAREAPENVAYFLGSRPLGSTIDSISAVELLDKNGELIRRLPANDAVLNLTALLSDGSLVKLDTEMSNMTQRLTHFGADGAERTAPPLSSFASAGPAHIVQASTASNGDSFTLVRLDDLKLELRAWSAEGALLWQQPVLPLTLGLIHVSTPQRQDMVADASRVCAGPLSFRVTGIGIALTFRTMFTCVDRSTGALLYRTQLPDATQSTGVAPNFGLSQDGTLVGISASCSGCTDAVLSRFELAPEGTLARSTVINNSGLALDSQTIAPAPNMLAHFAQNGMSTVFVGASGRALVMLQTDAAGTTRRFDINSVSSGRLIRLNSQADGSFVLHSWSDDVHTISAISNNGTLRWQRNFAGPLGLSLGPDPMLLGLGDNRIAIAEQTQTEGRVSHRLSLLDGRNGIEIWTREQRAIDSRGVRGLAVDVARGLVLVTSDRPGGTVLQAFALGTGEIRGSRGLPCALADFSCLPLQMDLATDGSLRLFADGSEVSRVELDTTLQPAAAAQSAIAGTWYNPATNGQGLLVDFASGSGDLFGAWFTFADSVQFGTAGLRWYTLGGAAALGADHFSLDIYRNTHGRFASAPITQSEIVGHAELRMNDCFNAVLSYSFNGSEMGGAQGQIGLTRLTPLTVDCRAADGSVTAATPTSPDLGRGIGRAQSGAWYAPETSGQGLLFDIRPPSQDGSDPGLLLGGWFSYDPNGKADDPTAQHWFLLQGDLSAAGQGRVEVPLYRATGGRFDHLKTDTVLQVGSVRLDFLSCDRAVLNYQFNQGDIAGTFAGLRGEMQLIKLLPCQP